MTMTQSQRNRKTKYNERTKKLHKNNEITGVNIFLVVHTITNARTLSLSPPLSITKNTMLNVNSVHNSTYTRTHTHLIVVFHQLSTKPYFLPTISFSFFYLLIVSLKLFCLYRYVHSINSRVIYVCVFRFFYSSRPLFSTDETTDDMKRNFFANVSYNFHCLFNIFFSLPFLCNTTNGR